MKRLGSPPLSGLMPENKKNGTALASRFQRHRCDQSFRLSSILSHGCPTVESAFRERTPRLRRINIDRPQGLFKLCKIGLLTK